MYGVISIRFDPCPNPVGGQSDDPCQNVLVCLQSVPLRGFTLNGATRCTDAWVYLWQIVSKMRSAIP